jgi:hypothetical protein
MTGFDFADPESGISASLRPSGAALIFDHDEVIAASAEASAALEIANEQAVARIELDGVILEIELVPVGPAVSLGNDGSAEKLSVCRVLGELVTGTETKSIGCLGIHSEAGAGPDPSETALTRSIAIAFSDGGILALEANRPAGAESHAEEEVTAALADPEGMATEFSEALLSTQYDEAGRQVRATLELWADEEITPSRGRRAAGTIVCGSSLPLGARRLDLAFFRWSMDGRPGLGRYEVLAAAANE